MPAYPEYFRSQQQQQYEGSDHIGNQNIPRSIIRPVKPGDQVGMIFINDRTNYQKK
jgi:hypothetical protein